MEEQNLLRQIPRVDVLLQTPALQALQHKAGAAALREAVRQELDLLRQQILSGACQTLPSESQLTDSICRRVRRCSTLRPVLNGTGVVLHTNLGRACLSDRAAEAVADAARGYTTLEYNVEMRCRGSRQSHVDALLREITGAEAALVVNNNAAAVLLMLSALARDGEVVTSRGELVEIGGSFRVPEIMTQCGCRLREVGTTNKTRLSDYAAAIGPETKALLKVHTSNFRIVGFTESVSLKDLVSLGRERDLPVIADLGSGLLVPSPVLPEEPTVQQCLRAGADLVSFSGDKLLGGPQAGIILGKQQWISRLAAHPLARAMRVDKLTLAALRATLESCRDPETALQEIPTLRMLHTSAEALHGLALLLCSQLREAGISASPVKTEVQVGGGSAPGVLLPSWAAAIDPGTRTPEELEHDLRCRALPIIGRISRGQFLLDLRTLPRETFPLLAAALREVLR